MIRSKCIEHDVGLADLRNEYNGRQYSCSASYWHMIARSGRYPARPLGLCDGVDCQLLAILWPLKQHRH